MCGEIEDDVEFSEEIFKKSLDMLKKKKGTKPEGSTSHQQKGEFLAIKTPTTKKEVQRVIGLATQLKHWVPELAFSTLHLR